MSMLSLCVYYDLYEMVMALIHMNDGEKNIFRIVVE